MAPETEPNSELLKQNSLCLELNPKNFAEKVIHTHKTYLKTYIFLFKDLL